MADQLSRYHQGSVVSLYPNPSSNKVLVTGVDISRIQFFSTDGLELLYIEPKENLDQEIDISVLSPGVYVVKVTYGQNNDVETLKCIKIK